MPLCTSVYMCLEVTCWERTDLLALVCGVKLLVCHFPIGILGQVCNLIVSVPDLCTLTYFYAPVICNHGSPDLGEGGDSRANEQGFFLY